jgi:hypothetical protein
VFEDRFDALVSATAQHQGALRHVLIVSRHSSGPAGDVVVMCALAFFHSA